MACYRETFTFFYLVFVLTRFVVITCQNPQDNKAISRITRLFKVSESKKVRLSSGSYFKVIMVPLNKDTTSMHENRLEREMAWCIILYSFANSKMMATSKTVVT